MLHCTDGVCRGGALSGSGMRAGASVLPHEPGRQLHRLARAALPVRTASPGRCASPGNAVPDAAMSQAGRWLRVQGRTHAVGPTLAVAPRWTWPAARCGTIC